MSNTRNSVSSGYPNTEERVENTKRRGVFFNEIRVFDIFCQSKQKLKSKRRSKIVKIYAD